MNYETVQFEMRDPVCVLTLNRPERLNALTVEVAKELKTAIAEALERRARAIVLTGAGRVFCAGGDLREMQVKKLLEASATNDYGSQLELERKAQIESGKTKDFIEGVAAFLEKRPPKFVGG